MSRTPSEIRSVQKELDPKREGPQLSPPVRPRWWERRNRSRRRSFMTFYWGSGSAVSFGINVALHWLLAHTYAFPLGFIASSVIMSIAHRIGVRRWDRFLISELKSGQPISYLRFLEEMDQEAKDRINNLHVSPEEKVKRILELDDRFGLEREQLLRDLLVEYRFAKSTVTPLRAGFDPRGGTFDAVAKLELRSKGYSVVLCRLGGNRGAVIKALREVNGFDYQEAGKLLSNLPAVIKRDVPLHEARAIFDALTAAGASVNIIGPAGN